MVFLDPYVDPEARSAEPVLGNRLLIRMFLGLPDPDPFSQEVWIRIRIWFLIRIRLRIFPFSHRCADCRWCACWQVVRKKYEKNTFLYLWNQWRKKSDPLVRGKDPDPDRHQNVTDPQHCAVPNVNGSNFSSRSTNNTDWFVLWCRRTGLQKRNTSATSIWRSSQEKVQ